ncbi:hypothetical protein [Polynucleobacter sphagniphilus]|uniref:Uncharacterized protein n=1 Tax=Polynucleobacter sphagniphilus TaxID=1743169 RepID=A0AA43MA24_9BURK|nr:hypothetical protein [Polynucleobacter sphagniphilus]MDH6504750.1 hypothetical protein [Polynucleobacter sphagniphilus]MDH6512964.1 hypothetical protein [Polynucleobacter sphagniphilus]
MIPIITSLVQTLAVNGLGLLAGAVQAKGKEFIESKIGARIPDNPSQEDLIKLKQLEIEQEQLLLQYTLKQKELEIEESKLLAEMHRASQENATHRWQSDMGSDSKLSKNIRPGTLVYILTAYLLFALLSAMGIDINEAYVRLLGEWGQLVMLAYFGGRSVEKIFEMRMNSSNKKKKSRHEWFSGRASGIPY